MEGYYDLHCHLLPGIDDGAVDMAETVSALKIARREGIRTIVFTPHDSYGEAVAGSSRLKVLMEAVKAAAEEAGITDMHFFCGNEVWYTPDSIRQLRRGEILSIAQSRYVLVEFPVNVWYKKLFKAVSELVFAGYRPVLAHVERYACLLRRADYIEELTRAGVIFQMNADCFSRPFPEPDLRWYRNLVKKGSIHLIATDAHGNGKRPPEMDRAVKWIKKHCERELAYTILFRNPEMILMDGIQDKDTKQIRNGENDELR